MNKLGIAFVLLAIAGFAIWLAYPIYSWRQKLTVEVETPQGLKRGLSIVEIQKFKSEGFWVLPEARGVSSKIIGEAAFVEVAPGKYLFALLKGADALAQNTYGVSGSMDKIAAYMDKMPGAWAVPWDYTPMLVTFGNINDPKTVQRVDPDNLASTFGAGYRLKSVTLSITDEPITKGRVEKLLGWLNESQNKQLDGDRYRRADAKNKFANSLNISAFKIGDN